MPIYCDSAEEILQGDGGLFHGAPGEIEVVVDGLTGDSAMAWYVEQFGGGAMILEPKHFGAGFLAASEGKESPTFVSCNTVQ
jgi:hypothetical protein